MKTWFITGASRGFGALIREAVLASGDTVVATARDPSPIAEIKMTTEQDGDTKLGARSGLRARAARLPRAGRGTWCRRSTKLPGVEAAAMQSKASQSALALLHVGREPDRARIPRGLHHQLPNSGQDVRDGAIVTEKLALKTFFQLVNPQGEFRFPCEQLA